MTATSWSLGISTFVWTSPLRTEQVAKLLAHIRQLGFDTVEVPLEEPDTPEPQALRTALADTGLRPVVGAVFSPGRELCAADPKTVSVTQDYLRRCIDYATDVGSPLVVGPMYTSVGRCWATSTEQRVALLEEYQAALAPIADYASAAGRTLAIEPLNRYETSLFNTVAQVLEAVEPFHPETVGVTFDTYHANIEEKRPWDALRLCGRRLQYVQASGSDRGAPGNDHIDWSGMVGALTDVSYAGPLTVESFSPGNKTIAIAASIWRPLEPSPDDLARDAHTHLTRLLGGCG